MKRQLVSVFIVMTAMWAIGADSSTGPTVHLRSAGSMSSTNPIDTFMYFIPLTSPVDVRLHKSDGNRQEVWIDGCDSSTRREEFHLECDFFVRGSGYYVIEFDFEHVIAYNTHGIDTPETITNLDYMRFEGDADGTVDVRGIHRAADVTITSVTVKFRQRRTRSPVSVELYSVDPVEGEYVYEKRYNTIKSRISSLSFGETSPDELPRMRMRTSSVGNAESPDAFLSSFKARLANFLIKPVEVNPVGNSVLIDFGRALYLGERQFTFPVATNILKE